MNFGLTGRTAIITGSARGLGFEYARTLGLEGATIAVNDIDKEACVAAVERLAQEGISASAHAADASDEQAVAAIIQEVQNLRGRIDILINNAGIGVKPAYAVEEMPVEAWNAMVRVHMQSTFLWSRSVIQHMRKNGFGRIVNISSMNFTGGGRPGVSHYAAAKAGIVGFTQTLAKEVARHGITANAIAPGYVATDLIAQFSKDMLQRLEQQNPIGRLCEPAEVAALVAFLCSEQAAFINGECVCMDGGRRDYYWG